MAPHFIITASEGRFRVLERFARPGQTTASLREIANHDFIPLVGARSVGATRPGLLASQGPHPGESAPSIEEGGLRRSADWLADQIERFLMSRPGLAWAFAAGPELHNPVLERLRPSVRGSLVESVQRNLALTPPSEIKLHFKVRI